MAVVGKQQRDSEYPGEKPAAFGEAKVRWSGTQSGSGYRQSGPKVISAATKKGVVRQVSTRLVIVASQSIVCTFPKSVQALERE